MRIAELRLRAFGSFTDEVIALDAPEGAGLHLFYGPNEAGKTTALRAIRALLYGVPERTSDAHRHAPSRLRVGAVLERAGGERLELWRRKGRKETLLDAAGAPIDPARLAAFLGGVDEELFATMFGLDHEGLVRGARALLEDGGDLGESLFGAGLGGSGVHRVLRRLQGDADRLWSRGASKKPINEALRHFRDARAKSRALALAPRRWIEGRDTVRRTEREQRNVVAELRWLATERHRLERLQQVLPLLARRRVQLAERDLLGDAAVVDDPDGEERRGAQSALREAAAASEAATREIDRLRRERAALSVPEALLADEAAVSELRGGLAGFRRGAGELPGLRAERAAIDEDIAAALAELGWSVDRPAGASSDDDDDAPDEAERLAPQTLEALRATPGLGPAQRARIEAVGRRLSVLDEKLSAAVRAIADIGARLEAARVERDALPAAREVAPVRRALERALEAGDLEARAEQAARAVAEADRRARTELAALGLWDGPLEDVARIAVPAADTVSRFADKRERLARAAEHLEQRARENDERRAEVVRRIDALDVGDRDGPTEEELDGARAQRDEAWSLLRWRLDGETDGIDPSTEPFERELIDVFERATERADRIADRLRREAARDARLAWLRADRVELERSAAAIDRGREQVRAHAIEEEAAWCAAWAPSGIDPLPPGEMHAWLHRLARVRDALSRIERERTTLDELRRRVEEHRGALARAVAELDAAEPSSPEPATLQAALTRASALVERVERGERRREELDRRVTELSAALEVRSRERAAHADRLAAAREEWARLIDPLRLSPEASPEEASAVLGRVHDLFAWIDRGRELRRRIATFEREATSFSAVAGPLIAQHAPELERRRVDRAAEELLARFERGRVDRATAVKIDEELTGRRRALEEAGQRAHIAQERLDALCARAGCADAAALERAERRARRLREIERDLQQLDEDLLAAGGGATVAELVAQTEGLDVDAVQSELAELQRRIEILRAQGSELDQRLGRLRHQLQEMDGASEAADAAAEAQQALARMRGDVGRYLRYRLAAVLLGREVERYREQHQGPVLGRASELFARLTLGAFSRLATGFDDADRPVLRCVRAGGEELSVRALSSGTRDQLYLALRLASIERHLRSNEPVPLVVDDVLIHFDDDRARAALAVLGELGEKVQVLLFTHHERHLELAREAVGAGGRLVEHRLGPVAVDA